jgi:hypothetical protein
VQPIPPDLAELLRSYLADRPAGQPIWGGTWARDHRGAEMLRIDLEAAGIPYAVAGPDGPLYADFHALRHSYLTLGGRAGIDLRTLQELAGHSTPVLTARYSHRRLHDLASAVERLPNFLPADAGEAEAARLVATGTEGPRPLLPRSVGSQPPKSVPMPTTNGPDSGCSLVAHAAGNQGHSVASVGNRGEGTEAAQKRRNPLNCQRVTSTGISSHQRGRRDSNPQPPDRQNESQQFPKSFLNRRLRTLALKHQRLTPGKTFRTFGDFRR